MIRQRFSNRNRRTEAKQKAPELELSPLGQELRLALEESLRGQPLQLRCAMRDKTLLILGEHLLHIEPNPEQTFANLEQAVRSIVPALLTAEVGSLPAELPVQLLLRIAGYQQPYATHTFRCDLSRSTAMEATPPSPPSHRVDETDKAPDWIEPTVERAIAPSEPEVVAASGVELAPESVESVTEVEDFTDEAELAPAADLTELKAIELLDQPYSSSHLDSDFEDFKAEVSDAGTRFAIEKVDPGVAAPIEVLSPEPAEVSTDSTDSIDTVPALDAPDVPVVESVEVVEHSGSIETAVEVENSALESIENSTAIEVPETNSATRLDQDLDAKPAEGAAVEREAIASVVEPTEHSTAIEVSNLDWAAGFIATPIDSELELTDVPSDLEISAAAIGDANRAEVDATESLTEAIAASEPPHNIAQLDAESEAVELVNTQQELYSLDQAAIDPVVEFSEEVIAPPDFLAELIQSEIDLETVHDTASAPLISSDSEQVGDTDGDSEILTASESLASIESLDDQSVDSSDETFNIPNNAPNDLPFDSTNTISNTELTELTENSWIASEREDSTADENFLELEVFQSTEAELEAEIPEAALPVTDRNPTAQDSELDVPESEAPELDVQESEASESLGTKPYGLETPAIAAIGITNLQNDFLDQDEPELIELASIELEPVELELIESELAQLDSIKPEPIELELIESQLSESELVEPGLVESELEFTQPNTIEPELIKSELAESELAESELIESRLFESDLAESKLVELGLTEPALNSTQLDSISPELIEPELTESPLVAPELLELTQPDSIVSEPAESEYKPDSIIDQSDLFNLTPTEDAQDLSLVDQNAIIDTSLDYEERFDLESKFDSTSESFDVEQHLDQFINQSIELETNKLEPNKLEARTDNALLIPHNLIDDRPSIEPALIEPVSAATELQDTTREDQYPDFANQEIISEDTLEIQNRSDSLPPEVETKLSSTSQPRAVVPSPNLPHPPTTETKTTIEKSSVRRSSHLVSLSAIGAFVTVSGVYALTRPCVVGSCPQLQQAQELTQSAIQTVQSTESALEVVDAYKKLNEASYILGTIPVWSPHYKESQALLNSYDEQAVTLKDVVAALEQANTVAKQSQNPPHPLPEWRKIQWQWREVIKQLERVSPESSLYLFAQRKLQDYRANLADINQRVGVEQQAQDRIAAARKAGQLAEARANAATTVEHWQETAATWETAIEQLKQIPQGTATYDEAQQLLAIYQPNLSTATTRQAQEQTAAIAYSEAVNAAEQARSLEQQNQWSQAAVRWQEAVNYSQQIPQNSGYYRQIQPLISSYTETLAQAKANSQRSIAIQTAKPSLDRACGELKICTYTLSPETVRVQFTTAYDRTVEQVINSSKKQGNVSFPPDTVNQVNLLLRDLAAVSETTQVPLELYDSNGIKLGIYTPSVSGYVPQ